MLLRVEVQSGCTHDRQTDEVLADRKLYELGSIVNIDLAHENSLNTLAEKRVIVTDHDRGHSAHSVLLSSRFGGRGQADFFLRRRIIFASRADCLYGFNEMSSHLVFEYVTRSAGKLAPVKKILVGVHG